MYIEKNGYLVAYPKEMSFLTEERDFSDDLNCAEIFSSNTSALEAISQFVNGEEQYIVLRYNSTVWIDKDAQQPEIRKETMCCGRECQCDEENHSYDEVCSKIMEKYNVN